MSYRLCKFLIKHIYRAYAAEIMHQLPHWVSIIVLNFNILHLAIRTLCINVQFNGTSTSDRIFIFPLSNHFYDFQIVSTKNNIQNQFCRLNIPVKNNCHNIIVQKSKTCQ